MTKMGQNTGILNASNMVQMSPITVLFTTEYQNLNSGNRRTKGRNSSLALVGKAGPPSSKNKINGTAQSILRFFVSYGPLNPKKWFLQNVYMHVRTYVRGPRAQAARLIKIKSGGRFCVCVATWSLTPI